MRCSLLVSALASLLLCSVAHAGLGDFGTKPVPDDCVVSGLGTPEPGDLFGRALAVADFDGDGIVDLAVGAPGESAPQEGKGLVFLYRGFETSDKWNDPGGDSHFRISFTPWKTLRQHDMNNFYGTVDDQLGFALVSGDFNGDGKDDLAIGQPGADGGNGPWAGRVFIGWGSTDGLNSFDTITLSTTGLLPTGYDQFGYSLASGDLDGDGIDDLAIGAPGRTHGAGAGDSILSGEVVMMLGSASGLQAWTSVNQESEQLAGPASGLPLGTHSNFDFFGGSLAIGELSGDDRDDLVVGAPGDAVDGVLSGAAYVFQSAESGMLGWNRIDQSGMDSNETGDGFGFSVAIGDMKIGSYYVNEIIVGAPFEDIEETGYNDVGRIYTFENGGGALGGSFVGMYGSYQTGASDNGAGDLFGYSLLAFKRVASNFILLVSAPGDHRAGTPNVGEVLLFAPTLTGPVDFGDGSLNEQAWIFGTNEQQHFGTAMAVDRSGGVTAFGDDFGTDESGSVHLGGLIGEPNGMIREDSVHLPPSCRRKPRSRQWVSP